MQLLGEAPALQQEPRTRLEARERRVQRPQASGESDADALRLAALVGPEAAAIRRASALTAAASALWIGQAALLAWAIQGLVAGPGASGLRLEAAATGFLALAVLRIAADAWAGHLGFAAAERIALRARGSLLAAVARTSPLDARHPPAGEVAAILSQHVEALVPYLTRHWPARLRLMLLPAAILAVTLAFSWAAALILLLAGPVIPLFMGLIGAEARGASERQLAAIGSLGGYLLDRLQGLTTIRLFDAVERTAAALEAQAAAIHHGTMRVLRIAFVSSAVLELFAALGVALLAVYIGFSLLGYFNFGTWRGGLGLCEALFLLLIAPEFFQPLRDYAAAYHDRAAALAASREIGRILEHGGPRLVGRGAAVAVADAPRQPPAIALEGVRLAFGGGQEAVLEGVSLAIAPGEHVALVGPSGSGKSVLLGLMAGLIAPSAGAVRCGGRPLDDATADAWRTRLAWLGQRPNFIKGSVLANLTLGRPRPDPARVAWALDVAAAAEVVARLPRGLSAPLGEGGHGVSGGEAQRLALARAALAEADVILADEPTEHLDEETARTVIDGLMAIAHGRTLVVATHDARLMARMARVIDMGELCAARPASALEASP
jgi:ATP-binding cassette, subfamily C, bacterial CydD